MLGGSSSAAQLISFANTILIARILSPTGAGQISGTYAVVGLASIFINWGLDGWMLREGSISADPQKLLSNVMSVKIFLGIPWSIGIFFLLMWVRPESFSPILLMACILDILANGLLNSQLTIFNATGRIPLQSGFQFALQGMRLLGTMALFWGGNFQPFWYVISRLGATVIIFGISLFFSSPKLIGVRLQNSFKYLRSSTSFAITDLLAAVYLQADVMLLTLFVGPGKQVGLYSTASSITNAIFVIPTAGYSVLLPVFTRLYHQRDAGFLRKLRQVFIAFAILGIALWGGTYLFGKPVVHLLLGSEYEVSGSLLIILSPILFFKSISFAAAILLVTMNWQGRRAWAQLVSALLNVGLNFLVIRPFGNIGVAYVYVISEFVLMVGYLGLCIRGKQQVNEHIHSSSASQEDLQIL